jgi:predicted transcriptional regulator
MVNIVDALISFIKDASLTQEKAADLLGISQPFLSQVLSGKRSVDSSTEQMSFIPYVGAFMGGTDTESQIFTVTLTNGIVQKTGLGTGADSVKLNLSAMGDSSSKGTPKDSKVGKR